MPKTEIPEKFPDKVEIPLPILNLCAKGMSIQKAWDIYKGSNDFDGKKPEATPNKPKKVSSSDKKKAIAAKLTKLGATLPDQSDSVAKWEQALAVAESDAESML